MDLTRSARFSWRIFSVALCLVPVVLFYFLLWHESRPVPMFDDHHAILFFALELQQQHGPVAKLLYLAAAQHDEYKLIVEHTLVALDLTLAGRIHFGLLILIGNLLVAATASVLWVNSFITQRDSGRRLLLFAPVVLLLFQLNYVENLDWAMCALQTMPVVFFSFAALHFALRSGRSAAGFACACAILACFSSANGFLIAPIGLAILVLRHRLAAAVIWSVSIALALLVYLYHYQRFTPPDAAQPVSAGSKLMFFFSFLGAAVENMHHAPIRNGSIALGVAIVLVLLYGAFKRGCAMHPFAMSTALWCILSAAIVAQRRSSQGLVLSLTGRYKIYSDLLLICCYLLAAGRLSSKEVRPRAALLWLAPVIVASALFCAAGDFFGYKYLSHRQRRVAIGIAQYVADPSRASPEVSLGGEPFAGDEPEFSREVLNEAITLGIYRLPASSKDW